MSIPRIPKLFFQTSKNPLEPYLIKMTKNMLGPGWKYLHFLDSDILHFLETNPRIEFPGAIDIFKKIKRGEHKADFFRYYFLYIKGGFFMDSDAMIYSPIEKIIKDYKFVSVNSELVPGTLFQGILGAEPENPLIKKALNFFFTEDLSALDSNYHLLCKNLFQIYQENLQKEGYHLFQEIGDLEGDRIVDSEELLFRHYWRNKEGIPNTIKSKNLIYCCVFFNKDYLKLLDLLLKSMKMFSTLDSFDFLVITSREFAPLVKELGKTLSLDLKLFTQEFTTFFQAACARLFIFDYPEVQGYEKLLYLDTDIIIKSNLAPLFQFPLDDLLYGIESGTIDSPSFGGQFFSNEHSKKRETPGINSGTLFFLNSKTIQDLFSRIRLHVETFTREGNQPPYCMDQPFINFHAIKDSLYNTSLLNPHVSLYEGSDSVENELTASICHFSFPIGNFTHKYFRMCAFLDKILKKESPNILNMPEIVGKKFNWGSGYIKFVVDYNGALIIETSWGNGSFSSLEHQMALVTWSGHSHVLKFNDDFSEYSSIRILPRDFQYMQGKLIQSNLIIYGDSHGAALFRNLAIDHRNLFSFGKTMFSQGANRRIYNFNSNQLSIDTVYCFVFGEVDARAHIGKHVHLGRNHLDICRDLVEAYISTIQQNFTKYKAIVIVGVPPPVDPKDHISHIHTDPLPFIGTNSDRVIFTNDLNKLLEDACNECGYNFLNPFDSYKREDGMLKYELSDECIHIGKNQHFLKAFTTLYELIQSPQIPIVLHTCDSYKKFWNPWFYYYKKFLQGHKVYFLTEEEEPEFSNEVICIKTGKEEWGERLLRGLQKIPEKFIYYMQEDFWPCKPIDLLSYTGLFVNYGMDALRIDGKSYLYSLDSVSSMENFYKFKQNSQYLMTHQFSLWNKEFFSKNINPKHNPWVSEIEQSKIMATNSHSIYLYDEKWYNAVVKKGILQENGEEMLKNMIREQNM